MPPDGQNDPITLRTSEKGWFRELANAYKDREPVVLCDDAQLGIDPVSETLFMMGVRAKLSVNEVSAACIALGMAAAGVGLVIAALLDPEPTSKLGLLVGGGVVLIFTGGWGAIHILVKIKPPCVKAGKNGFEINWD